MTKFVMKALIRAGSIFVSILLLKIALDGLFANEEFWVRLIYLAIVFLGIPLIFVLSNVVANLIDDSNKGTKQ